VTNTVPPPTTHTHTQAVCLPASSIRVCAAAVRWGNVFARRLVCHRAELKGEHSRVCLCVMQAFLCPASGDSVGAFAVCDSHYSAVGRVFSSVSHRGGAVIEGCLYLTAAGDRQEGREQERGSAGTSERETDVTLHVHWSVHLL
jgi:hypothetical protein